MLKNFPSVGKTFSSGSATDVNAKCRSLSPSNAESTTKSIIAPTTIAEAAIRVIILIA